MYNTFLQCELWVCFFTIIWFWSSKVTRDNETSNGCLSCKAPKRIWYVMKIRWCSWLSKQDPAHVYFRPLKPEYSKHGLNVSYSAWSPEGVQVLDVTQPSYTYACSQPESSIVTMYVPDHFIKDLPRNDNLYRKLQNSSTKEPGFCFPRTLVCVVITLFVIDIIGPSVSVP